MAQVPPGPSSSRPPAHSARRPCTVEAPRRRLGQQAAARANRQPRQGIRVHVYTIPIGLSTPKAGRATIFSKIVLSFNSEPAATAGNWHAYPEAQRRCELAIRRRRWLRVKRATCQVESLAGGRVNSRGRECNAPPGERAAFGTSHSSFWEHQSRLAADWAGNRGMRISLSCRDLRPVSDWRGEHEQVNTTPQRPTKRAAAGATCASNAE